MGIRRYHVRCAGCNERIRLRITVGTDERQPFYFPCPVCAAPTRGTFFYHGGSETSLALESGEVIADELENPPTVSISADIPSIGSAAEMWEPGGSAFMHFAQLIGIDAMQRFISVSDGARANARKYGTTVSRLLTYFRTEDWARFDTNAQLLLPPVATLPSEPWQRADFLHRVFDAMIVPVLALDGRAFYPVMKEEWNALWSNEGPHLLSLIEYGKLESKAPQLLTCHRDLLTCLERYLLNLAGILPGALCNMVPEEKQQDIDELRLFRDDFEALRDFYVTTFEACHRSLRWVIASANVAQRGSIDAFLALSTGKPGTKPVKTLKQFEKIVNAEKRKYLNCLPVWDASWDQILDRSLRNDFGHASARHDLTSGTLHRDGHSDLPYPRFLQRVHHAGHALLACANVLKLIRISPDL
jgi:hypothetical protein